MDWCWNCFADGMSFYFDKDWIINYPQVAKDSFEWIIFLYDTENNYLYENSIFKIQKPKEITWDDIMIHGFKFLIENYLKNDIEIINYFIKDDYLLIHFKK
jgi:hypothetical protein